MRIICMLAILALTVCSQASDDYVYFGTYTKGLSKGIYVARFNPETGNLSKPELAGETTNPSFVAIHPTRKYLYAIGETGEFKGKKTGAVSAFKIDAATGRLTLINQASSGGTGPCHVIVDKAGTYVLMANYSGGNASAVAIREDGSLGETTAFVQHEGSGPNLRRQQAAHAHSINLSADNRFVFVADLGIDKVMVYKFDTGKGTFTPNDPAFACVPPGGGPRHFAFHPNGRFAYVINELTSTITGFSYQADRGSLTEVQTISTLPAGFTNANTTAEVQVHPSGKFVYGSNRGHNSITIFSVDEATGKLAYVDTVSCNGSTPRNFCVHPSGNWMIVANQDSNNVVVYRIETSTGKPAPAGQEYEVGMPVCVKFMKAD